MDSKVLLLRIIQERPSVTSTHLAKLAYLFDLTCVYVLGKQASDIQYLWWQYGPYTPLIEKFIWELEEEGRIRVKPYKTRSNHDCRLHEALDTAVPRFQKAQETVLQMVLKRYSRMTYDQLISAVYKTPPMLEAKKRDAKMEPLKMDSQEGMPDVLKDVEAQKMILRSHKPGTKWILAADVIEKLIALPTAG